MGRLQGGVSCLTKVITQLFTPLESGLLLTLHSGRKVFLFGRLRCLIGDEAALKAMWAVKGAAGTLPCLFCWNVVQARSDLHLSDPSSTLVPHTCFDIGQLQLRTDAELAAAALMLSSEKPLRTKKAFETLEQSLGINFNPDGMLFHPDCPLKPIEHTMFDWLHVYLVNGIFQCEINLLPPVLAANGRSHAALCQFMKSFQAPQDQKSNLTGAIKTFEKSKTKDGWKPFASEVLCTYPLLRLFVMDTAFVQEGHILMASSFLLLCRILDLLSMIGKDVQVDAVTLEGLIQRHLTAFKNAHGEDELVPKFHYALHLPPLLRQHGLLISCWTHERKHKSLKLFANQVSNAGTWYEMSVLREVTHSAINCILDFKPSDIRLQKPKPSRKMKCAILELDFLRCMDGAFVATVADIHGLTCHAGDVALLRLDGSECVGRVHLHADLSGGILWSVVSIWEAMGNNRFKITSHGRWVETRHLVFGVSLSLNISRSWTIVFQFLYIYLVECHWRFLGQHTIFEHPLYIDMKTESYSIFRYHYIFQIQFILLRSILRTLYHHDESDGLHATVAP